jgi:serpin B
MAIALGVGLAVFLGIAAVGQFPKWLSVGSSENPSPVQTTPMTPSPSPSPEATNDAPEIDPQLVNANNRFGWRLFSQIRTASPQENIFISPTSITTALQMTLEGAKGETKQAIAQTLALQNLPTETRREAMAALAEFLSDPAPEIQLDIANALWVASTNSSTPAVNPSFVETVRNIYQAEVGELNFSTPEAIATINNWVAENTNGKIEQITRELPANTVAFLANAIYFKGLWAYPFDPENTENRDFYLANGETISHPFISQNDTFPYYENDLFQAVSLPYGKPGKPQNLSLYVFLPKSNISLSDFYQQQTPENWQNWMQEFRPLSGSIALPKLQVEYEISLTEILANMGMEIAFDPANANFTEIRDREPKVFLDRIQHKTFLEVNEEGTEAAGATSVRVGTTSVAVDTFDMEVNRPFFLTIRDNRSGTILFMGAIANPS